MRIKTFIALSFSMALAAACTSRTIKGSFKQNYNISKIRSLVILPFSQDSSAVDMWGNKTTDRKLNFSIPDEIGIELLETGTHIIDKAKLDKELEKKKLSLPDIINKNEYTLIGKAANTDAILPELNNFLITMQ